MRRRFSLVSLPTSVAKTASWTRLASLAALPIITLIALGLRLYKLTYWDYWDDEVITTFAARVPPAELFYTITANDTHPPLYHMLLHFWIGLFGDDLLAIRLFSVLISTACVPLMFVLGRMLVSKPVALVAATLMAIAPFQIYHGQQARMYPLLTFLVLLATLLFVWAWRRGGWGRWLAFGICVTAGFYTHVYFPFSLLALNLWALYEAVRQRQIAWRRWAGLVSAQVLGVVLFLPFVPQMLDLTSSVVDGFWIQNNPFDWIFALVSLSNNATIFQNTKIAPWYLVFTHIIGVIIVLLVIVYSAREVQRHAEERPVWMLLHFLLWTPIVVATTLSLTIQSILLDRSLIGLSSALYLLLAWVIVRCWRLSSIQVVTGLLLLTSLASLTYVYPDTPRQNSLRPVADYVSAESRPGDAIAYADWQSFDTAALIYPEQPNVYVLPGPSGDTSGWERRMQLMRWHTPENIQSVPEFAPNYQRVWVVLTDYTYNRDYHERVNLGWLEEHGQVVQRQELGRADLLLYEVLSN